MGKTKIEWTDKVWNPVTGCTAVSEGCRNCYARRMAYRLKGRAGYPEDEPFRVTLHPDRLAQPSNWKKPTKIFVCSMGDLFHELIFEAWEETFIDEVFAIMAAAKQHTFIILTKRPKIMNDYLNNWMRLAVIEHALQAIYSGHGLKAPDFEWPLPNVWLNVSVENQATADERISLLLKTPAAKHGVSIEPMLGAIDIEPYLQYPPLTENYKMTWGLNEFEGLDWVICGGETGPGARPMHPGWVRSLRDQCIAADVPFFFKQWGEWAPIKGSFDLVKSNPPHFWEDGAISMHVGRLKAGRELDGRMWEEMPDDQLITKEMR